MAQFVKSSKIAIDTVMERMFKPPNDVVEKPHSIHPFQLRVNFFKPHGCLHFLLFLATRFLDHSQ